MSTTNSAVKTRSPLSERLDLIISPIFAAALAILGFAVWTYSDLDKITIAILSPDKVQRQIGETLILGLSSSILVVLIAVPVGILVTRKGYPRLKNLLVNTLGLGQALPAYGLIVIFFSFMGSGIVTVILPWLLFRCYRFLETQSLA